MSTERIYRSIALATMFGLLGFSCGDFVARPRNPTASMLRPAETPPLEYFVSQQSFSEIQNSKILQDALCSRCLAQVLGGLAVQDAAPDDAARVIRELERCRQEFQGTEQELRVTQTLLLILKHSRLYEQWMALYVRTIYEHPTSLLVGLFARDAVAISRSLGREDEVLRGLERVRTLPMELESKRYIENVFRSQTANDHLVINDNGRTVESRAPTGVP